MHLIQVYLRQAKIIDSSVRDDKNNIKLDVPEIHTVYDKIKSSLQSALSLVNNLSNFESFLDIENQIHKALYDFYVSWGSYYIPIDHAKHLVENGYPGALDLLKNSFRDKSLGDDVVFVPRSSGVDQSIIDERIAMLSNGTILEKKIKAAKYLISLGVWDGYLMLTTILLSELRIKIDAASKNIYLINQIEGSLKEALKWGCEIPEEYLTRYITLQEQQEKYDGIVSEIKAHLKDGALTEAVRLNFMSYLLQKEIKIIKPNVEKWKVSSVLDKIVLTCLKHRLLEVRDDKLVVKKVFVDIFYSQLFSNDPRI